MFMPNINYIMSYFNSLGYMDEFDFSESIIEFKNNLKELKKINNGVEINKDIEIEKTDKIVMPPELISNHTGINYKNIISYEFSEEIAKFARIMTTNFSSENLVILYNNINDLKIEKIYMNEFLEHIKNIIFKRGTKDLNVAGYNVFLNRVRIEEEYVDIDMPHELFHMASSVYDKEKKVLYTGFVQTIIKENRNIGDGINEGYTEWMVAKYYDESILSDSTSYKYLCNVARNLDEIVGKDKMENLYLKANLKGLVEELVKYNSYDNVMHFISATDYLYHNLNESRKSKQEKEVITNELKFINKFMIESITKSTALMYSDNEISIEDIVPIISKKIKNIHDVKTKKEDFNVKPDMQEIAQIVASILNEQGLDARVNKSIR